ncbi:MAG: peptidoglycan DD-metalloendopeptidase family protein [Nocardioides sp.]
MHYFPRARHRRAIAVATAFVLTLGIPPSSDSAAVSDDDLADRRDELAASIETASDELDGASREARDAVLALRTARQALVDARRALILARQELVAAQQRDAVMQARLERAERRLAIARADLQQARAAVQAQRDEVRGLVTDLYTDGDPRLLAFSALLRSKSVADLTWQAKANQIFVSSQVDVYDELAAAEAAMQRQRDEVRAAALDVAARRREAAENLARITAMEAEAENAAAKVVELFRERRRARISAARVVRADRQRLAEFQAEDARVQALLRRRAELARARAGQSGRVAGSGGALGYPVSGRVTSPFGYRRHPIYGYWGLHDGIDFASSCGTPLYAVAPGRVLSSYFQSAYGNRLLIDHGAIRGVGLATIYNHATSYVVSPGSWVGKGQLIGYLGNTGWSTGCHLHFTVTADGKPVDPMTWL